jgi:uncharacterized protein YjbJ (UPF0337 family)
MGITDKAKHKAEQFKGRAKQAIGNVTGNRTLQFRGRFDQAKGSAQQAGERAKDAFRK